MKVSHIIIVLIIFAWPLNYLYQRQLGAISFLLLAIFFLVISIKEMKKLKEEDKNEPPNEKIK
ncbi:hypothetical protein BABA_22298 [Neobacillus bataviensis LMG 21833]|uniref:Uncharacterized protein n=1 Tax=Neobacillus bataviensis LMG 21833 TaxID=1117379 RepID=K6C139_9BACI|nr:hypothetical protein [Neobacillus bataviensis]EKN64880.1 hypothetical protein BABA_22298 [Neobacillus bataviensis LMG 21833]